MSIPTVFIIVEVVAVLTLAVALVSVFIVIRRNRRKSRDQHGSPSK